MNKIRSLFDISKYAPKSSYDNAINDIVNKNQDFDYLFKILNNSDIGNYQKGNWKVIDASKNPDLAEITESKKTFLYDNRTFALDTICEMSRPEFGIKAYLLNFSHPSNEKLDITLINGDLSSVHIKKRMGPFDYTVSFASKSTNNDEYMKRYENKIFDFAAKINDELEEKIMSYARQA